MKIEMSKIRKVTEEKDTFRIQDGNEMDYRWTSLSDETGKRKKSEHGCN